MKTNAPSTTGDTTWRARKIAGSLSAFALLSVVLSGCTETTPEERLEAAGKDLRDSTAELQELNRRIEDTDSLLAELRSSRRDLRDEVRTLEQRVEARATDVAVFRAVHSVLLQDDVLLQSAIEVSVDDGTVTLSGTVSGQDMAQRAIAVAKETAGVDDVRSTIDVYDPAASVVP